MIGIHEKVISASSSQQPSATTSSSSEQQEQNVSSSTTTSSRKMNKEKVTQIQSLLETSQEPISYDTLKAITPKSCKYISNFNRKYAAIENKSTDENQCGVSCRYNNTCKPHLYCKLVIDKATYYIASKYFRAWQYSFDQQNETKAFLRKVLIGLLRISHHPLAISTIINKIKTIPKYRHSSIKINDVKSIISAINDAYRRRYHTPQDCCGKTTPHIICRITLENDIGHYIFTSRIKRWIRHGKGRCECSEPAPITKTPTPAICPAEFKIDDDEEDFDVDEFDKMFLGEQKDDE